MDLISDHVARFNAAVRSGDYGPMLEQFSLDAELAFEGVPVGPFDLLEVREIPGGVVVGYAWRAEPSSRAGAMHFELNAGRIARLVVSFEASSGQSG